jgi:hypothetical protein
MIYINYWCFTLITDLGAWAKSVVYYKAEYSLTNGLTNKDKSFAAA